MKNISLLLAQLFVFTTTILSFVLPSLGKEVCVRNIAGKIICGEVVNKQKSTSVNSYINRRTQKNQSGVDLTFEGCEKSRDGLLCSISVYNSTDYDKTFKLYGAWAYRSSLIDSEGNEYIAQRVALGSKWDLGGIINASLPPKLKIRSQLLFRPSGRLSNYIRVLNVRFDVEGKGFNTVFRDSDVN